MDAYLDSIGAEDVNDVYKARFAELDRFEKNARSVHAQATARADGDDVAIGKADERLQDHLLRFEKNRQECQVKMQETDF